MKFNMKAYLWMVEKSKRMLINILLYEKKLLGFWR